MEREWCREVEKREEVKEEKVLVCECQRGRGRGRRRREGGWLGQDHGAERREARRGTRYSRVSGDRLSREERYIRR